jgi:Domain of unknown function (DUF4124)
MKNVDMRRLTCTVIASCTLLLALLAGTAAAEQIYRSIDADGNVTFSSQPPAGAVTVDEVSVQPGPSEAAQREARERMQRQEATADELSEARARRTPEQPQATPAVPEPVEQQEPVNQYYGYPDPNTARRDKIRDRLQERPVQLPTRPVRPPARPAPR